MENLSFSQMKQTHFVATQINPEYILSLVILNVKASPSIDAGLKNGMQRKDRSL